jgi:hypothetical protein
MLEVLNCLLSSFVSLHSLHFLPIVVDVGLSVGILGRANTIEGLLLQQGEKKGEFERCGFLGFEARDNNLLESGWLNWTKFPNNEWLEYEPYNGTSMYSTLYQLFEILQSN